MESGLAFLVNAISGLNDDQKELHEEGLKNNYISEQLKNIKAIADLHNLHFQ